MILRRLTTAFRNQDWFTVVVETLIVVFGVFIGLQVNNWNAARHDRQLGETYTVRLIADLEKDLVSSTTMFNYYTQVLGSIEAADRLLSGSGPDPRELVAAAYRASEFSSDPANRATWEQMVSAGHLGLLPSRANASRLSDYYKFQDSNEETLSLLQGSPYRLAARSLIPLPVQVAIREGCSDVMDDVNVIVRFTDECRLDVDAALLDEAAQVLIASAAIRETLRHQYSMVASVRNNVNGNIALIEIILDELRGAGEGP